jgi:hypothetical protein
MVQINSGYILNQGIQTVFNLLNNKVFDLSVFQFGVGKKEDYVFSVLKLYKTASQETENFLTDRTWSYDPATRTFTISEGDDLVSSNINITLYPKLVYRNDDVALTYDEYTITSITDTTITISEAFSYGLTDITLNSIKADNSVVLTGKYPEFEKIKRSVPVVSNALLVGDVQDIVNSEEENTVEINCVIPEDNTVIDPIFFDEVYLYGRNDNETELKLIFVAETVFGEGIYTGLESNIFNIRLSLSNLENVNEINYNINNLSVKKDLEVIQLMFLYTLSMKNRNIRDINKRISALDSILLDFQNDDFTDIVFEKLKTYVFNRLESRYSISQDDIYSLDLNLMDGATLGAEELSQNLTTDISNEISRVVGIVSKKIGNFVGGYVDNATGLNTIDVLFYVKTDGSLKAYDLTNQTSLNIINTFNSQTFGIDDEININILTEILVDYSFEEAINI